ncbi:MAG TPA: hypothetical protein QF469_13835 [Sphingomonas sanguinis]|jgi:hypothetical protein|uniref:hypothetical protein n=1 Tax=Sphingomonas TaxID=13687 RepID=UPI0006FF6227|nr:MULTISPECIES: hypothetical protein [Sphingomonas]KQO56841.1 hypothetical protein ASF14_18140 [Sphingomonas sp. Leaf257]HJO66406.1 hypothetical protein [Sphingomonas sanguinis]
MSQVIYTFTFDKSVFRLACHAIRIHSHHTLAFESVSATALKGMEIFLSMEDPKALVAEALKLDQPGDVRVTLRIPLSQKPIFQRARDLAMQYADHPVPTRLAFVTALLAVFYGTFNDCSHIAVDAPD